MNKWISVEDELPLKQDYQSSYLGVEVLVTDGKNTAVEIFCIGGNHIDKPWAHFSDYSDIENITHWMPLPKPPEV